MKIFRLAEVPKTNPIQTQFKPNSNPIQTQFKANQTQFQPKYAENKANQTQFQTTPAQRFLIQHSIPVAVLWTPPSGVPKRTNGELFDIPSVSCVFEACVLRLFCPCYIWPDARQDMLNV